METKVTTNKVISLLIAFAMLFSFVSVVPQQEVKAASTKTTGFYVDGTTIRDANDKAFVMRGINHAHVWYQGDTTTALKGIANTGANTVRIVLGDGAKYDKISASAVESVIKQCISLNLVPVLEVHDATGSDSTSYLTKAVNYWIEIKSVLQEYEKYVIVNIANEWMGSWNQGSKWASAYKTAIASLRNAGINNLLIVDAPGWGQEVDDCVNYCQEVFNSDSLALTAFLARAFL